MFSNRLAFIILGFACVTAAAGGGYFATRQNATETAVTADAPSELAAADTPVQETEASVGESRNTEPVPALAPPAPAAPARQAVTPRPAPEPSQTQPARASRPATMTTARNTPVSTPAENPPQAQPVQTPPPAAQEPPAPAARQEETLPETVRAPEPEPVPERTFQELVVSADSVIGLEMETALTSEKARVEDRVEARVTRDVRVGGQVAIPSGAHAIGTVTAVDRGGKFKERARIGIRFTTLVLADGTTLPITTETIYRYGEAPQAAAKIGGGAVGGAILGAILGGAKGAAIGAAAGAGGGAATVQAGDRNAATFANGTQLTARFLSPVTVTIEQ